MKTVLWIDDSHDNQKLPKGAEKRKIETALEAKLYPDRPVNRRDDFVALLTDLKPNDTLGIIMDYQLTDVGENKQMVYGSTWAAEARAQFPSIPIIGISHCPLEHIPHLQLESFLAFFPRKELAGIKPKLPDLKALLRGYRTTVQIYDSGKSKSGVTKMIELLNPPEEISDLVRGSIPSSLRNDWDVETPHIAGRWIWHEFQDRPGFLFDSLELATYLGLNIKGFERVEARFIEARYNGAYSSDGRQRWWIHQIRNIVSKITGCESPGPISNGRESLLLKLKIPKTARKDLLSRPYGRKGSEEIPDTVAFGDDEESFLVQAMFEDTYVDERNANPPFGFEARRTFRSATLQ